MALFFNFTIPQLFTKGNHKKVLWRIVIQMRALSFGEVVYF